MKKLRLLIASMASTMLTVIVLPVAAYANSGNSVVYNSVPSQVPPNVASLGFEATSTSELADYVHLSGADRNLKKITATMSTWARYSEYSSDPLYSGNASYWTHPITVSVYDDTLNGDGVPTTVLATKTKAVNIPWRPAGDPTCADTGYGAGFAWKASDGVCYNGFAFNAVFDLSSLNAVLPDDVIVGISYNTADYGDAPIHLAGPYNSLNVGIPSNQAVTVGSDNDVNAVFWDTTYPGYTAGLRNDTGWSPNGTVALKIEANTPSKDECKRDGWRRFNGHKFKNEGECVSYCNHQNHHDHHDREKKSRHSNEHNWKSFRR